MRRVARVIAIVAGIVSVASAVLTRGTTRPLLSRDGSGVTEVTLIDGNLRVSWEPRVPYRPRWAGQVNRWGFRYNVYSDGSGYAWAPPWATAALAGTVACAAGYVGWRPRGRARRGLCPSCAYDTRATPGRCPECGYVAASKSE